MAADVSRQIKNASKSTVLITRDFLGAGGAMSGDGGIESKELDLDLHVPTGFEKRLDLKSGKVYLQRCSPKPSPSSSPPNHHRTSFILNQTRPPSLQDLNIPPHSKPTLDLLDDPVLDLKLVSSSPPPSTTTTTARATSAAAASFYQSVCTLDKVKSALDRAAGRDSYSLGGNYKKRPTNAGTPVLSTSSLSPSNSSSNMSVDDGFGDEKVFSSKAVASSSSSMTDRNEEDINGLMAAAACPGCLLYVLISKSNPKCPRCGLGIQLPVVSKKPRIDLNISM